MASDASMIKLLINVLLQQRAFNYNKINRASEVINTIAKAIAIILILLNEFSLVYMYC